MIVFENVQSNIYKVGPKRSEHYKMIRKYQKEVSYIRTIYNKSFLFSGVKKICPLRDYCSKMHSFFRFFPITIPICSQVKEWNFLFSFFVKKLIPNCATT